jgi:diaminohydroxyphosphoribosylaminopyrimidine deaminase/5-amino-6-(5-phosphoribosylamino)uracil reductase
MTREESWMAIAIKEAQKGQGQTTPNPAVGAVIVDEGQLVAKGFHAKAGGDHAEIVALKNVVKPLSENAELYVTLEPCSTQGKTPPCTEAIIKAKIRKVFVGAIDPNPKHRGAGIEKLKAQGVCVKTGFLEKECENLNIEFNQRMKKLA